MRTIRHLSLICLLIVGPGTALGQGVCADTSVGTVLLSTFDDLPPNAIWTEVDELPFWAIPLSPPADYYATVDADTPAKLRSSVHEIIDGHITFRYTHPTKPGDSNHKVDTWDIVALADAHPNNHDRVLDVYLNGTFDRQLRGVTTDPRYDREHSWPKSLGFPDKRVKNSAYTDCHHLFAAYQSYNASRSNKPYGTQDTDAERRKTTLENAGRGGALTDEPDSSNYSFKNVWQTWIGRRGDVARAMFYMDVRYEGDATSEPDLRLTDTVGDIRKLNVWESSGTAFMGIKSVLLDWHLQDPVDDLERHRNAVVYLFQRNRNPFIDHPEWVNVLFGDGTAAPTEARVWINEFHYDNAGADENEFVELAGTAGLSLVGWQLVGYNGAGGRAYKTTELTGQLSGESSGFGVRAFAFPHLQNGSPDGVALVNPGGQVIELLSYEGHFTATDGPANGMVSEPVVNVSESNATTEGDSLQRIGTGNSAAAFTWSGPAPATRGAINTGQVFVPAI